eukprot:TRINITY_DN5486_c1_g7_i1.p1 TRINITY_DN5486_c1_g7~~TRINITY_DN5486_c1_g7_i1.p1  ORF type:complete len:844 (-),score=96.88 TRINITY_DN5486_c1_g7_i1:35-2566(-)
MGITRPLFLVMPPSVQRGSGPPPIARSNLQLIGYLYSKGMPIAALTVMTFSVLIPSFKFITTLLIMLRPQFVTRELYPRLCLLLNAMSPYQMSDVFLVMQMVAYLSIGTGEKGLQGGGSGFTIQLRGGFVSFFSYCVVSVMLAQALELEHWTSSTADGGVSSTAASSRPRSSRSRSRGQMQHQQHVLTQQAVPEEDLEMEKKRDHRVASSEPDPDEDADVSGNSEPEDDNGGTSVAMLFECLAKTLVLFLVWAACLSAMIFLHLPPMSLQARVGGIVVFKIEPSISELLDALLTQSVPFAILAVTLVALMPIVHTVLVVPRILLQIRGTKPDIVRRLWLSEQIVKPWVMGDVAVIAISSLYLSIQEPFSKAVYLCVRIPDMPLGFFACLGTGVTACGLRWSVPPLHGCDGVQMLSARARPASARASRESLDGSVAAPTSFSRSSQGSAISFSTSGRARHGAVCCPESESRAWFMRRVPWREALLWGLWGAVLYQLGPHQKPTVHTLEDLNDFLSGEAPTVTKLVRLHAPRGVGDCDFLEELRETIPRLRDDDPPDLDTDLDGDGKTDDDAAARAEAAEAEREKMRTASPEVRAKARAVAKNQSCRPVNIPKFTIPGVGLHSRVAFVDGLRTFQVQQLQAIPEPPSTGSESEGRMAAAAAAVGGQRWGLRLQGKFDNLNVWMLATKNGRSYINGTVCCPRDFHWMIQLSVVCSDAEKFHGNVNVDTFSIDPLHFRQTNHRSIFRGQGVIPEEQTFGIDIGDLPTIAKSAVIKQLEKVLVSKTGGAPTKSGAPSFSLTETINKIIGYNGGLRCPKFRLDTSKMPSMPAGPMRRSARTTTRNWRTS